MTGTPCSSAMPISVRTKSLGKSSRLLPADEQVNHCLPITARTTSLDLIAA